MDMGKFIRLRVKSRKCFIKAVGKKEFKIRD
jgi:hypothetical protein